MEVTKLKKIEINENGMIGILYANETIEDDIILKSENHRESLHISRSENHRWPKVARLFLMVDLYPGIDDEPTTSERDIIMGRIARRKQLDTIDQLELNNLDTPIVRS